jgi:hypothetical protein
LRFAPQTQAELNDSSPNTPHHRERGVLGRLPLVIVAALVGLSVLLSAFYPARTSGALPSSNLNFQARLSSSTGSIVPDGYYSIQFKIYNVSTGGTALWTETYDNNTHFAVTTSQVRVVNGYLTVNLGSQTAFPNTINWDQEHWITMNINADGEMNPRLKLTAVPYAFQAGQLAKTDGANRGTLGFGTVANNPNVLLPDASGTVCLQTSSACGFATGSGAAILQGGNSFGTTATLGTNDNFDLALETNGTTKLTIQAAGNVGIGIAAPEAKLHINGTVDDEQLIVRANSTQTNSLVKFQTSTGVTRLYVDSNLNMVAANGYGFFFNQVSGNQSYILGSINNTLEMRGGSGGTVLLNNTGSSELLKVLDNGNVGIGTNAPTSLLHVAGSQPIAVATNGTNATRALQVTGGKGGNTTGTTGQVAGTGAVLNLTAGAGGDAPSGSTNGTGGSITLQGGAPGSGLGTAGSYGNILLAPSGGRVGIGTSGTPSALLSVGGTTGNLTVNSAGNLITSGTLTVTGLGTFNGGLTVATGSTFTNASSSLFTAVAITDRATGGDIGTAAATVDVATTFNINQTTVGQTITIPAPTVTTAGRIIYISNVGTTSFSLLGATVSAGATATLMWNGTAWTNAGADGSAILNQKNSDQNANFRISGTGQANGGFISTLFKTTDSSGSTNTANITLQSGNANTGNNNTSGTVTIKSGDAQNGNNGSTGNVVVDVGVKAGTGTAGSISIGTANTSALTLGRVGVTTTNAGALTVSQLLTGNLGATISGAAINLNAGSNFATSINTGTSTGAITLGGGSSPFSIDSTAFDVSTTGAVSGVTTLTASSTIQGSVLNATTGFRLNGTAAAGNYLRADGTNFVSSAIQAADIPDLGASYIKNGTTLQTANFNISGNGHVGGNVGIGIANAAYKLHVSGDYAYTASTNLTGNVLTIKNAANTMQLQFAADGTNKYGIIQAAEPGTGYRNLLLQPGGGNVGIGTAGPGYKLDVQGGDINTSGSYRLNGTIAVEQASNFLRINQSNQFTNGIWLGTSALKAGAGGVYLGSTGGDGNIALLSTSADTTRRITLDGGTGNISASSLTAPLLQNAGSLTLQTTATAGADDIVFNTAGSEKLRVLENGNVGIGTAAPATKLDVNGPLRFGSYTEATLPAAGITGRLVRLLDGVRGLWLDQGSQWVPLNQNTVDVREFGAKCDDITDDAAAIQAAIDVAGNTAAVRRSGIKVVIPGPCAIGSTILLNRKSITISGMGWGYQNATGAPKSYLRWIGPAGQPMVRIQDTFGGARIEDLRFIGNTTNKPDSAIDFYETDDGVPNIHNAVENVSIGTQAGEGITGNQFVNGIRFQAATVDIQNDTNMLTNVRINGCDGAGIKIGHRQAVNISAQQLGIYNCQYALSIVGTISGSGWFFAGSTGADIQFPATDDFGAAVQAAKVEVSYYGSELAKRMADLQGSGFLTVHSGYFQTGTSTHSDGRVIATRNNNSQHVRLESFAFTQSGIPPAAPYLEVRSAAAGASSKSLIIDNVTGMSFLTGGANGIDVLTESATDRRYVYYREAATVASNTPPKIAQNTIFGASGLQWDADRFDTGNLLKIKGGSADGPSGLAALEFTSNNAVEKTVGRISTQAVSLQAGSENVNMIFSTVYGGALTEAIRIQGNGTVGIGTSTPSYKLDVSGAGRFTGSVGINGSLPGALAGGQATGLAVTGYTGLGGLRVNGADFTNTIYQATGNLALTTGGGNISLGAGSGTSHLTVISGGNVGIGTVSPTERLQVAGNVLASGTYSTTAGGAAGTGTQALASNQYVQSRGMNLVANGNGLLGNNYNFSSFTFDQVETYSGKGSFKNATASATAFNDELLPVDPGKHYEQTLYAKSTTYVAGNRAYFGISQYDIDNNIISPVHHMRQSGTDTTLAAPLAPGDTTISLTSAASWNNAAGTATHLRNVAVYGYANSLGYTYPNYTYTRRVVSNAYADGGVNYATNTITLSSPWPSTWGTIPAGTAISNGSSGGTYKYVSAVNVEVPNAWTKYSGVIGGIDTTGTNRTYQFAPGTAFAKLLFLMNRDVTGNVTNISTLSLTEATGRNTNVINLQYDSNQVGLAIQGAAAQAADLLQIKSSTSAVLSKFDSGGNLVVSATGNSSFAGNLSVGTTSATSRLVVKGSGNTSATSALNVTNSDDSPLLFVRNDGKVGIGTTGIGANVRLEVNGNVAVQGTNFDSAVVAPTANFNGAFLTIGDAISPQTFTNGLGIKFHDAGVAHASIKYVSSANRMDFCSSGNTASLTCDPSAETLSLDLANKRVGIGTTNPGALLSVGSSNDFQVTSAGTFRLLENGASPSFYGIFDVGDLSSDQTFTFTQGGLVCTDSGNCNGAGSTLQTAYNNSIGGSTPEIKLGATRTTLDIQDADTTLGASTNLLAVRSGNSAGLGNLLFGVQANGNVTASSTMTIQGANALTLGTASTNVGAIVFNNAGNSNTITLRSGTTVTPGLALTLPTADGGNGHCLKTDGAGALAFSDCLGGGSSGVSSVNTLTGDLTIQGTANQVNVSSGGSTITLSTAQDINTTSSVTFGTITTGQAPTSLTTVTDNPLSSTATTVNVVSTTGYPSKGTLLIGSEAMTYTGKTGTSFTGVTRGALGTAAATHSTGTAVNNYLFVAMADSSNPRMVMQGNGNVGIGTVAPGARLAVQTQAAIVGQIIQGASGQTADLLQVKSVSATLMSVDAGGVLRVSTVGSNPTLAGAKLFTTTAEVSTTLRIGTASDGVEFSASGAPIYRGNGRPTRRVTLVPEYPGATMTGTGGSNSGAMSSDFCSGALSVNTSVCAAGDEHNYYSWTTSQGTAQNYDIYVRYQLPSDFDGFVSPTDAIRLFARRSSTGSSVEVSMFRNGTQCGSTVTVNSSDNTWQENTGAVNAGACSFVANDAVMFRIKVTSASGSFAYAGALRFDYYSKF